MRRQELEELHYITPIANIASIQRRGILSHRLAAQVAGPQSVAAPEIQARRIDKRVPGGRLLHDHVNLYINARNPMMYVRSGAHRDLCVLRVTPAVLDLPDVVIADKNAASGYARFWTPDEGLANIDRDMVFAERWNVHDDEISRWNHKSIMCAEALAPDRVDSSFVMSAYVSCDESQPRLQSLWASLPAVVYPYLFFR